MKKIFKRLSIACSVSLLVAGLASCDIESLNNVATINLDVDLNEKIDLNVIYPNPGMSKSEFKKSRTTEYFEEITGYKVKYEFMDDEMGVVNSILADKQEYHMLKLQTSTYNAYVGDQVNFVDLKPALEKYGQNLLAQIPQEAWDAVTIDGKIYAVPEVGFGQMIGNALVWNVRQLEEVGITEIPDTISEVDTALRTLQTHFNPDGKGSFRAFGMPAASSYIEPLAAAFDLNKDFYVNEKDEVAHVMYDDNYFNYMSWLNSLQRAGCISQEWQKYQAPNLVDLFVQGILGCAYLPYWYVPNLVEGLAAKTEYGSVEVAKEGIDWSLKILGDGTNGSAVQSVPKTLYYESIGYCITIPMHMAEYGAYVIDWMDKRITDEAFQGYRLGEEGVHYEVVDSTDPDAIKVKISDVETYVKLTKKYSQQILPTSMYQTGVNPKIAKELWILSEQAYDCWEILIDTDYDNIVGNAIAYAPYVKGWSEVDINSRSWVITQEQIAINSATEDAFKNEIKNMQDQWPVVYWNADVDKSVQEWHKSKSK